MGLVGLVQLTERLLNQTLQNSPENQQDAAKNAGTEQNAISNGNTDAFVPSGPNGAAEAGIFQVTRVSLFSEAAGLLLAQPKTAVETAPTAPAAAAAGSEATANRANGENAVNILTPPEANRTNAGGDGVGGAGGGNAPTAANTAAANTAVTHTAAPNAGAANADTTQQAQVQLSSLNASLAALGLSQQEITVVDRVAQLVKDFNPTAFTDIINQLQALATAQSPKAVTAAPTNGAAPGVAARAAAA